MPDQLSDFDELSPRLPFPVVGIGSSAGGLEAMLQLLSTLDAHTGMAYVYIQHLDPFRSSMLTEILRRATSMDVIEVADALPLAANCLFVIPPNKDLTLNGSVFKLTPRPPKPAIHLPIDIFFESLAEMQKENSIGIILSGNANDGVYGLKCLKQAGGITMAQDTSAKFDGMPSAAIADGEVDMILSPVDIGIELKRIGKHLEGSSVPATMSSTPVESSAGNVDKTLADIIQRLYKETGVDFIHYKPTTILRRVTRRLLIYRFDSLGEYLNYIVSHPEEIKILYQDVLIHVTSFFRDPETVELAKKIIFPPLRGNNKDNTGIRIWIPGCASGEEAYSLAILMREVYGDTRENFKIQIFATDLSERCIAKARLGVYTANELARVSEQRLKKFFEPLDGNYRIVKDIRDLCIFSVHNVLRDPPFSRMDLVSCCNLMIYLSLMLQKKLMSILHYALKEHGILILGKSESVSSAPTLFSQIDKKCKLFSRTQNVPIKERLDLFYSMQPIQPIQQKPLIQPMSSNSTVKSMENQVDDLLLRKYIPPCLVVNASLDILQFRGPASVFFEPSQGKASLNVLRMVKPSLAFEIQHLVNKSQKAPGPVKNSDLLIKLDSATYKVVISLTPLVAAGSGQNLFCITIMESLVLPGGVMDPGATPSQVVQDMQKQLERVKEDMHSIIEGRDASVEELQSANEEITSSNEELQTINEELETSKEEVESANEELQSINRELQLSNRQLTESYEYSDAVFETISEAVLILTPDFKVKVANTAFYEIFKTTRSQTEGTLLFDLGTGQWDIYALRKQLKSVISGARPIEDLEIEKLFPGVDQKVLILNARRIIGSDSKFLILLAIKDISEQRRSQQIIIQQEMMFRNMANNIPVMIWTLDSSESCNFMNKSRLEFTGRSLESELGNGWMQDIYAEELETVHDIYKRSFRERVPFNTEYRLRKHDASYRWVSGAGSPNFSQDGNFIGYVIYCLDIHDKKLALKDIENIVELRTQELKETMTQLVATNAELSQFAYAASHDLQEPVRKILIFTEKLRVGAPAEGIDNENLVQKIESSAERMRTLIRDLLDLTKLSVRDRVFEPIDLTNLVSVVLQDFDLLLAEKKVSLELGPLPVVMGLPVQLHQLFYNLISNALKFSIPGKEALLQIREEPLGDEDGVLLRTLDDKERYTKIIIQDQGIGFHQEFAEEIFTIFKRLNGNKQVFPGSGIGLALCKKIVINHRGAIYASSEPGNGACFTILLPLAATPTSHDNQSIHTNKTLKDDGRLLAAV